MNNNNNNEICFIKHIWRNKIIKNQIFRFINLNKLFTIKFKRDLLDYEFRNQIINLNYLFQDLKIGDIPPSVIKLILENLNCVNFNYESIQSLPSIKILKLITKINVDFKKLPTSIHTLDISGSYDYSDISTTKTTNNSQSGKSIPSNIETLIIGNQFNRSLALHPLHNGSLTSLSIGGSFNQVILVGVLPSTLTSLTLLGYNKPIIHGTLPNSLVYLKLPAYNSQLDQGVLPSSITYLDISFFFSHSLSVGTLPANVKTLLLNFYENRLLPGVIPASCIELHIGRIYNYPLSRGVLPDGLTNLNIDGIFDCALNPGDLPSSLCSLILSSFFNQPILSGTLGEGLTYLQFGNDFNQPLNLSPNILPSSLESIQFGTAFNQSLLQLDNKSSIFSSSLKNLSFGSHFNQLLVQGSLNEGLEEINFQYNYDKPIYRESIPSTVKIITLYKNKDDNINQLYSDKSIQQNNIFYNLLNRYNSIFKNNNKRQLIKITYILNNNEIKQIIQEY